MKFERSTRILFVLLLVASLAFAPGADAGGAVVDICRLGLEFRVALLAASMGVE